MLILSGRTATDPPVPISNGLYLPVGSIGIRKIGYVWVLGMMVRRWISHRDRKKEAVEEIMRETHGE